MKPAMAILLGKIKAHVDEDIYALSELVQWYGAVELERSNQFIFIFPLDE